jgi:hypothetical protein
LLGKPCYTVRLDCLCSMVTMPTKLFTVGNHGYYGNQVVYFREEQPKGVASFRYKGSVDIF